MKIAIIYKTFFGASLKYAEWLHNEIDSQIFVMKNFKKEEFDTFDTIVIISGTYMGGMPLARFLVKHWPAISEKKIIVAAVGMVPPDSEASVSSYNKIPEEIRSKIKYFKLPGELRKRRGDEIMKNSLKIVKECVLQEITR